MAKVSSTVHGLAPSAPKVHVSPVTSRPVGVGCGCHQARHSGGRQPSTSQECSGSGDWSGSSSRSPVAWSPVADTPLSSVRGIWRPFMRLALFDWPISPLLLPRFRRSFNLNLISSSIRSAMPWVNLTQNGFAAASNTARTTRPKFRAEPGRPIISRSNESLR